MPLRFPILDIFSLPLAPWLSYICVVYFSVAVIKIPKNTTKLTRASGSREISVHHGRETWHQAQGRVHTSFIINTEQNEHKTLHSQSPPLQIQWYTPSNMATLLELPHTEPTTWDQVFRSMNLWGIFSCNPLHMSGSRTALVILWFKITLNKEPVSDHIYSVENPRPGDHWVRIPHCMLPACCESVPLPPPRMLQKVSSGLIQAAKVVPFTCMLWRLSPGLYMLQRVLLLCLPPRTLEEGVLPAPQPHASEPAPGHRAGVVLSSRWSSVLACTGGNDNVSLLCDLSAFLYLVLSQQ